MDERIWNTTLSVSPGQWRLRVASSACLFPIVIRHATKLILFFSLHCPNTNIFNKAGDKFIHYLFLKIYLECLVYADHKISLFTLNSSSSLPSLFVETVIRKLNGDFFNNFIYKYIYVYMIHILIFKKICIKLLMYPNPHKYEWILLKLILWKKCKHIWKLISGWYFYTFSVTKMSVDVFFFSKITSCVTLIKTEPYGTPSPLS